MDEPGPSAPSDNESSGDSQVTSDCRMTQAADCQHVNADHVCMPAIEAWHLHEAACCCCTAGSAPTQHGLQLAMS